MRPVVRFVEYYLPGRPWGRPAIGYVLTAPLVAVILLALDRYGIQQEFFDHVAGLEPFRGRDSNTLAFYSQLHFSTACVLLFVLLPWLFDRLFPSGIRNPYGLALDRRIVPHLPAYLLLLAFMVPVVYWASLQDNFVRFYPMYKPQGASDWWRYELVYMLQFVAVEFFFRGFALYRLERLCGLHAVTIMTIPYALIHIHKPFPEALASVVAGLALGLLSIRTRSIWPGVFIHCTVALSMDTLALYRAGWFVR